MAGSSHDGNSSDMLVAEVVVVAIVAIIVIVMIDQTLLYHPVSGAGYCSGAW